MQDHIHKPLAETNRLLTHARVRGRREGSPKGGKGKRNIPKTLMRCESPCKRVCVSRSKKTRCIFPFVCVCVFPSIVYLLRTPAIRPSSHPYIHPSIHPCIFLHPVHHYCRFHFVCSPGCGRAVWLTPRTCFHVRNSQEP